MRTRALVLLLLLGASACEKESTAEGRIVVVTVAARDGAIRLRNARTGKLVRTLRNPCAGMPYVLPSPAGDAVIVECEGVVHRVPIDGKPRELGTVEHIGAVSGDGKLVWASMPDQTFVMLHADGRPPTPVSDAEVGIPMPSPDGFVTTVPATRTLRHIRAGGAGITTTDVALPDDLFAGMILSSTVRGAPLVFERVEGFHDTSRTWLMKLGSDGKPIELAEASAGFSYNAVNTAYAIYFGDDERIYRLPLKGGAPTLVLDERDTSHLYPAAIDLGGRLLLAEAWGDDLDDASKSCIDLATGAVIGTFKLTGETVRGPLIELR